MDEYLLIRAFLGSVIIVDIAYTGRVFNILGKYMEERRKTSFIQIFGGILMAAGFSGMHISDSTLSILFATVGTAGAFMMIYPPVKYGLVEVDRVLLIQSVFILLSGVFVYLFLLKASPFTAGRRSVPEIPKV